MSLQIRVGMSVGHSPSHPPHHPDMRKQEADVTHEEKQEAQRKIEGSIGSDNKGHFGGMADLQ